MRFILTKEMKGTIIKLLVLQQMINKDEELSYKELKLLKKNKLLENFVKIATLSFFLVSKFI